jgi:hypothetical protein
MSMHVDYSTPLTKEERAYLEARGDLAAIQRADSLTGVTNPPEFGEGDGTGPQVQPLMTSEQRAAEKANLQRRLAELEAQDGTGDDGDEDGEVEPYPVWTNQELTDELKRRSLAVTGSKAEKIARLEEDDAKMTAEDPQS